MANLVSTQSLSRSRFLSLTLLAYDVRLLASEHPRDSALVRAIALAQGIAHCGPVTTGGRLSVIRRLVARAAKSERQAAVLKRLEKLIEPGNGDTHKVSQEVGTWQRTSPARA
jgi:hypothetical protein